MNFGKNERGETGKEPNHYHTNPYIKCMEKTFVIQFSYSGKNGRSI